MKASIIAALFAAGALAMPYGQPLNKRATIVEEVTTTQWTTTTVFVEGTGIPAAFAERNSRSRSRSSNSSSIASSTASSSSSSVVVVLPTSTSVSVPAVVTPTSTPAPAVVVPTTTQPAVSQQTQPVAKAPEVAPASTGSGPSGSGQLTFYSLGQVSCGQVYSDSDYVVALATGTMANPANPNNNPLCGKTINITYKGKTMQAKVVDTCEGCAAGDVDLSPSLFNALVGDFGLGRVGGATWSVA